MWLLVPSSLWARLFWPPDIPIGATPFPTSPSLLRDPRKELSLAEILAEFQGCWLGLVGWCGWMEWGWGDTMT